MPIQTTSAIVIRHQALGEHDKLITFYTLDAGKLKAVARSARRPGNRLTGSLDLLNHGELVYFDRPHKDLQYVNSFDIRDSFAKLKEDLAGVAYGFYIAELVDQVTPERDADPEVYQLLLNVLQFLMTNQSMVLWVRAFEIKLLSLMGVAPQLDLCVACDSPLTESRIKVSPQLGGIVCERCDRVRYRHSQDTVSMVREAGPEGPARSGDSPSVHISRGSWKLMQQLQRLTWADLGRFRLTESASRELENALSSMILYHLGRPLKTLDFLETIKIGHR